MVRGLAYHTAHVNPDFFSSPGRNKRDGHDFIPQAIEAGAVASFSGSGFRGLSK